METPNQNEDLRSLNLVDLLVILAKYKRVILRTVLGAVLVTALLLFLVIPRWYRSTAIVMAPKQQNALGLLGSISKASAPLRTLGLGGASDELSDFQTILASRRVLESVIQRFDMQEVYGEPMMEKAIKELQSNVSVGLGDEDVSIEISVLDTDPERAAAMANFFVAMLDSVYREMSVAEARSNRIFLEARYVQNLQDLQAAEDSLKAFQEKYGVYSVPDQVKAAVEAAASLESRIALEEVRVRILKSTTTESNPLRMAAELQLRELRKQLAELQRGAEGGDQGSLVFPPFEKAPEMGIAYLRHYRELELQGTLLELILPLYEQARIEERRNTPAVVTLDRAVPAERHAKPKRLIILLLVAAGTFLLAFFGSVLHNSVERSRSRRSPEEREKLELIRRELNLRSIWR